MSDLHAAVEGLETHEAHANFGIEWLCVPTGLDHPPRSKDCGDEEAHYRLIDSAAVLALIPEGAVLVTEAELAAALRGTNYVPFEECDNAAAIIVGRLRHLREGT